LPASQLVARPDAGENPIGHADGRLFGRHERADLRHDGQQRHLAMYVLLPAMFGTGNEQNGTARFCWGGSCTAAPSAICWGGSCTTTPDDFQLGWQLYCHPILRCGSTTAAPTFF